MGNKNTPMANFLSYVSRNNILDAASERKIWERIEVLSLRKEAMETEEDKQRIQEELELERQKIINANLRLVISIAKKYRDKDLSFMELVDEGILGMMEAIKRFDYKRGFRFTTYGAWWIQLVISQATFDQTRNIRIPMHLCGMLKKYRKLENKYNGKYSDSEKHERILADLGVTHEKFNSVLMVDSHNISSFDLNLDDKQEPSIIDNYIDTLQLAMPEQDLEKLDIKDTLHSVISDLSPRERKIITMRFGLNNSKEATLEEISKNIGITRERVRQIQNSVLLKLKNHTGLEEFS